MLKRDVYVVRIACRLYTPTEFYESLIKMDGRVVYSGEELLAVLQRPPKKDTVFRMAGN